MLKWTFTYLTSLVERIGGNRRSRQSQHRRVRLGRVYKRRSGSEARVYMQHKNRLLHVIPINPVAPSTFTRRAIQQLCSPSNWGQGTSYVWFYRTRYCIQAAHTAVMLPTEAPSQAELAISPLFRRGRRAGWPDHARRHQRGPSIRAAPSPGHLTTVRDGMGVFAAACKKKDRKSNSANQHRIW